MNSATSYGRLSESELLSISGEDIAPIVFRNARNDDVPVSIWLGGQPGAGKSSAARCVCGLYPNRSIVMIDGDDYRQYHPQFLDVAEANPLRMPEVTQRAMGCWIAMTVDFASRRGFSSLIEGTWRNSEVVLKESRRAKVLGRTTHACVIGVSPIESGISILRRYIDARSIGRKARWTPPSVHDAAIGNLPQNVKAIATDGSIDRFTVLDRDGTVRFDSMCFEDRGEAVSCWGELFSRGYGESEKQELFSELSTLGQRFRRCEPDNTAALAFILKLTAKLRAVQ